MLCRNGIWSHCWRGSGGKWAAAHFGESGKGIRAGGERRVRGCLAWRQGPQAELMARMAWRWGRGGKVWGLPEVTGQKARPRVGPEEGEGGGVRLFPREGRGL